MYIEIGKIVNTHGIKGELRVMSDSDFKDERFKKNNTLYLKFNGEYQEVVINSYRTHKNFDLITINNLSNINDVLKFVNSYLYIKKEDLKELGENEFHYENLLGLEVVSTEGEYIGIVKDIMTVPQGEILVIYNLENKRILIPFVPNFIKDVKGKITVQVIEGLI